MELMVQRLMKKFWKKEEGLTLIELLAVIVILGIIAAIAVPRILGLINGTRDNAREATATQIYEAARLFATQNAGVPTGTVTLTQLQTGNYLPNPVNDPSTNAPLAGGTTVVNFDAAAADPAVTLATAAGVLDTYTRAEVTN